MRVRHLVSEAKTVASETKQWATTDLPPRHAPYLAKTRPIRAGWQWRSAELTSSNRKYVLTGLCNPSHGNWQAILTVAVDGSYSVVARFEFHASHPGLHAHADCSTGGVTVGAAGMDNLARIPEAGARHRRQNAWTETTFWDAAKLFFGVEFKNGPLFDHST